MKNLKLYKEIALSNTSDIETLNELEDIKRLMTEAHGLIKYNELNIRTLATYLEGKIGINMSGDPNRRNSGYMDYTRLRPLFDNVQPILSKQFKMVTIALDGLDIKKHEDYIRDVVNVNKLSWDDDSSEIWKLRDYHYDMVDILKFISYASQNVSHRVLKNKGIITYRILAAELFNTLNTYDAYINFDKLGGF